MKRLVFLLALAALAPLALIAADEKAAPKPKQFVYMLRLVPRLHDDGAWTEADKKIVNVHFAHLKTATTEGKIILVGRTLEPGDKTFGLVIFAAQRSRRT